MLSRNQASRPLQGQRAANRLRLGAPDWLELTSGTRPCLLDDISATGAHLRIGRPIAEGVTAAFRFHELRVYATVAWCRESECGLRFEKPLPVEDMQGMLWIVQNREVYDRICRESGAQDWSLGIGD